DSAPSLGQALTTAVGERVRHELDRVAALGNGTTEPQGFFNASGIGNVNSANGATGPPLVSDYESLWHGVAKQYRQRNLQVCYVANDLSYQRARSIQVGAADQRRVFGMDEQGYMLLEFPYRIVPDLPNTKIGFACLKKMRLWQRAGMEIRW